MSTAGVLLIVVLIILGVLYNISLVLGIIGTVAVLAFIVYFFVFIIKDQFKKNNNTPNNQTANSIPTESTFNPANLNFKIGETIYTKVAGVTFNGVQYILPTLRAGMPLRFFREPFNKYDKNAIAIECNGTHIGHLSAALAKDIAPLMDNGASLDGKIVKITGGNGKTYGCNIEVTIYQ